MNAVIDVFDQDGLVEFARGLSGLGVSLFAAAECAQTLTLEEIPTRPVADLAGPRGMSGCPLPSAQPFIRAGILANRDDSDSMADLARRGVQPIDLVIVNVPPFDAARADAGPASEDLDRSGLIRAAAANYRHVVAVVEPADYPDVLSGLADGGVGINARRALAARALQIVATLDTHLAAFLRDAPDELPDSFTVALTKVGDLKHGENPHQRGALYVQTPNPRIGSSLAGARQLRGGALSFNAALDLDAALACARDFAAPTVALIRHGSPCGLACGDDLADAYARAHDGNPEAAIGGTLGINRAVDAVTARAIAATHYSNLIAPGYDGEALDILAINASLRIFQVDLQPFDDAALRLSPQLGLDVKRIAGGFIVQTSDSVGEEDVGYHVASHREPTLEELTNLLFGWRAVKHVRSDAVVLAKHLSLVGVGAGQPSRDDATTLAVRKAGNRRIGAVLASDSRFTLPDAIELLADAGVTAVIQPGGATRDDEVLRAADRHHIALVLTGRRHYRH